MKLEKINEILDFAIAREEEANKFYLELAEKMERPNMKKTFHSFAVEELKHKAKLEAVRNGRYNWKEGSSIIDLQISDYVVDIEEKDVFEYQHALIIAMKREKAAFRMYSDIAESIEEDELKGLFLNLAQEEAKHKLRFEIEYDDIYLQEN